MRICFVDSCSESFQQHPVEQVVGTVYDPMVDSILCWNALVRPMACEHGEGRLDGLSSVIYPERWIVERRRS